MARQALREDLSSPNSTDEETLSLEDRSDRVSKKLTTTDSLKQYVTDVLHRQADDDEHPTAITVDDIQIDASKTNRRPYENVSAFRHYHSHAEGFVRTGAQQPGDEHLTSDDEIPDRSLLQQSVGLDASSSELNMDPNPILEERESADQVYKQKVYLRQLQPPTPQPVEIQVQEVLVKAQAPKPPIHVRVGKREPRTPSPIIIKSTPPQPPPHDSDQPIIYNKYVPPPKQPPQQIIIHRYPDLPPKPRPIVVEQWLPHKPAPKRIIKHSLPPEATRAPPPPHNLIVSYGKPRTLVEVELVRLPIVKIDPTTYQQMSAAGQQQLAQHPSFQHEQDYLSSERLAHVSQPSSEMDWRI